MKGPRDASVEEGSEELAGAVHANDRRMRLESSPEVEGDRVYGSSRSRSGGYKL
jgi:hypothetical protein